MKPYTVPFGYKYDMGKIIVDNNESVVVKYIFELASQRLSLNNIALMVAKKYPEVLFNKNKVSRILKDERYTGNDIFECIVDRSLFDNANHIQRYKSTNKPDEDKTEILLVKVPFRCPECSTKMTRFHDARRKCPERWRCTNPKCNINIRIADADLIDEIKVIVANIQKLKIKCKDDIVRRSIETARIEGEIKTKLSSASIDIDQLREEIINLASRKYKDIPSIGINQKKIMDDIKFGNIAERYIDFINNNALSINIESDRSITIVLKDGTKHRRNSTYVDSDVREREESNTYSSNQKLG